MKKLIKTVDCKCGCRNKVEIFDNHPDKIGYLRGHHKPGLGKLRLDMIGNTNGFKKGLTPWNKGKSVPEEQKERQRIKMIGRESPNKDKKFPERSGINHHNWKGDKVGYTSLHSWVRRQLGSPNKCEMCGKTESKKFEWANISHEYKRDLLDWIRLCTKCHRHYDNSIYKSWVTRRQNICA